MWLDSPRPLTRLLSALASCALTTSSPIMLASCTRDPAPRSDGDTVATVPQTRDTFPVPLTAHYVKLIRDQLTAKDPYQAQVIIYCEVSRIMILLTNQADDPLEGHNRAVRLLKEARERAFTAADAPARARVDSALSGKVFNAQPGCDSLARAGLLGDTVMPSLKPRRF
jgi:hypothetical protein